MPLIHRFVDPEKSHRWAVKMAKYGLLTNSARTLKEYPELRCNVFDIEFKNPIGNLLLNRPYAKLKIVRPNLALHDSNTNNIKIDFYKYII